jgi:hypothetical protein
MCPQIQTDSFNAFNPNPFVAKDVHIERYSSDGWGRYSAIPHEKCRFLAAILLEFPCFRQLLVTLKLLGIPFEQE